MDSQRFNSFRAFLLAALMLPFLILVVGCSLICGIFERRWSLDFWSGLGLPVIDSDYCETIDSIMRI